MKQKVLSIVISAVVLMFSANTIQAQTPLTTGGGPVIENCSSTLSQHSWLRNDDKTANFYLNTYSPNPKLQYQGIVTYNKSTNTAYTEEIQLPIGYRHLYSRSCGSDYLAYYYRYNAENKTFDYSVAKIPQKKSTEGFKQVNPEVRLSIDLTGRGEIMKYTAVSPDESMYAITFIVPNERNQAPYFYCFIYDKNGTEVWYDKFLPTISGSKFSIQDIGLSDKGELLLLVYATKGKNATVQSPTLQLFSCTRGNITSITEPIDYGFINSMKMLRLKNKDLFIGGYYSEDQQSNTTGYFTYIVGSDPFKITAKAHEAITYRNEVYYDGLTDKDYFIKCDYLYEQSDKIVVMLGEQHTSIQQHGDKSSMAFRHHTNDVYCNRFTLGGTDLGYIRVNKHQSAQSGLTVTTHDDGERIGCYLFTEKRAYEKSPTFANLNITYFPIFKDNEIYILYGDKFSNFDETSVDWEAANMEKGDENCVVLTKVDRSVDKKVVMSPSKAAQVFNSIWLIDGQDIYFGMMGKKSYTIEKFKLNKQWSWDK